MLNDLRYAIRVLVRSPGFTAVAVLTLALGIGANTAIFSVVYSVLLRPLPFDEPDRLVMLWERNPKVGLDQEQVAPATFVDWQRENRVFDELGFLLNSGTRSRNFVLATAEEPVRIRGRFASSGLFDVLRTRPILGRVFESEEDQRGGPKSALLSYAVWQRYFSADPDIAGKRLRLDDSYTIVGVMPPDFRFPPDAEIWLSWSGWDYLNRMNRYDFHGLWAFGRLKPGVSLEQAQAEMNALQGRIAEQHPEIVQVGSHVVLVPLLDQLIGQRTRAALLVLFAAVGFVLLIACANVANLLLARAAGRHKEIAIRTALGASRWRVMRQLLAECLALAACGGGLGMVLALWGIRILGAIGVDHTYRGVTEFRIDRVQDVSIDLPVLGFTLLVSLLTATIFGLFPAAQTLKLDVNEWLKEEGRSSAGTARQRARGALLVAEVALAVMLLIGAGLMIHTLMRLQQIDPGFEPRNAMLFEVDMEMASRTYAGERPDITLQVLDRVRSVPGVAAVGAASEIPLRKSGWTETIAVQGRANASAADLPTADVRVVTPDLFRALGVPLLQGRDFSEQDGDGAASVALVNETMARQFFPNEDPVGKRLRYRGTFPPIEIVGVVGDMRRYGLEFTVRPEVYQPYRQQVWGGSELGPIVVVRTTSNPQDLLGAMRHEVEGPNSKQRVIGRQQTLETILGASIAEQQLRTGLLGLFAAVALVLATVGIYGVVSYTVSQRMHELGIRMALGAQRTDILGLVMGQGFKLAALGVLIGLVAAFAGTRTLSSMLYGVAPTDPATYAGVSLLLTVVSLVACYIPARRATKVDPTVALRHE